MFFSGFSKNRSGFVKKISAKSLFFSFFNLKKIVEFFFIFFLIFTPLAFTIERHPGHHFNAIITEHLCVIRKKACSTSQRKKNNKSLKSL